MIEDRVRALEAKLEMYQARLRVAQTEYAAAKEERDRYLRSVAAIEQQILEAKQGQLCLEGECDEL